MTLFFGILKNKNFSKNHTRRSAIKFCVDPIFVGSELIGNRTSYEQNTVYIKYDDDGDDEMMVMMVMMFIIVIIIVLISLVI